MQDFQLFSRYKGLLWGMAAFGFIVLNTAFLYYALAHPDLMDAAMRNPVSLVFIVEAFVMMAFAAWLIARAGWRQPGWVAFIVLSMVGSLAFSVPAFILWHLRKHEAAQEPVTQGA